MIMIIIIINSITQKKIKITNKNRGKKKITPLSKQLQKKEHHEKKSI